MFPFQGRQHGVFLCNPVPLFFTHIPKTAGTSFKKSLVLPNIAREKILDFKGVRALIRDRRKTFDFLDGHYPYGVHRFVPCPTPAIYATILREPLDRAISHYYFIKQCDTEDYRHPDLEDATRWDISTFYEQPKYQNLQTKFIAGLAAMKIAELFPQAMPESLLLAQAKYNLSKKYHLVGLTERMPQFEEMAAKKLGWRNFGVRDDSKVTRNRPKIDAIIEATRNLILRANHLDVQLYEFALNLFNERADNNPGDSERINRAATR
jgi:hypothetical protein